MILPQTCKKTVQKIRWSLGTTYDKKKYEKDNNPSNINNSNYESNTDSDINNDNNTKYRLMLM